MALINISNLTFAYEGSYDNIFCDVSFQIDTDWKLGFVGRNGRGKTTFLHLLQGKYEYTGLIHTTVTFDYFPFEVVDKTKKTIDIIYEMNPEVNLWQINIEFSLLDLKEDVLDRAFETLSNGEQTKALLASLFLKDNNFLLLDEPTNHLDSPSRLVICKYLKLKKGYILVSHDRMFLDSCVDHILAINKTNIEVQKGNFSTWQQNKQRQDHFENTENEKLQRDINKMSEASKRTATWSETAEKTKFNTRIGGLRPDRGYLGHKAAKVMKRAKSYEKRQEKTLENKKSLLKNVDRTLDLALKPMPYYKNCYADFSNISIIYDDKIINERINFVINEGDRIVLNGKNGSGKTSILKLLIGEDIKYYGSFSKGSGLIISYIPQDTSFLNGSLQNFIVANNLDESLFKAILHKLDFSVIQFEKEMENFSAGQKKKVLIAMSLCVKAHLYVWDEPLNYIDVISRIQIENMILQYKPTIIFVEHDNIFSEKVATKVINLG